MLIHKSSASKKAIHSPFAFCIPAFLAARVAARAAGGEVLVTRSVVELSGSHLEFERIGEVRLKGFDQATELFLASAAPDDG